MEEFTSGLWCQRDKSPSPSQHGNTAASSRQAAGTSESIHLKLQAGFKLSKPTPMTYSSNKATSKPPKQPPNWGPSIQMPGLWGQVIQTATGMALPSGAMKLKPQLCNKEISHADGTKALQAENRALHKLDVVTDTCRRSI